ncbi:hypothetical protein AVEN_178867-1 [Araneus ventricosus]|uniref:Uncharacterized protein n=1 Tax=Araneus ventricosus TaxID=182803 RepID=A0A4Y2NYQ4_ARAVE|nr:hypothetical protein AVEN_178867-1 [Araneus ventricosus]
MVDGTALISLILRAPSIEQISHILRCMRPSIVLQNDEWVLGKSQDEYNLTYFLFNTIFLYINGYLSDRDHCSCSIGKALHLATECALTLSWHMMRPTPNFEQEWVKRAAFNFVPRQKIRWIMKFINENRDLFLPP